MVCIFIRMSVYLFEIFRGNVNITLHIFHGLKYVLIRDTIGAGFFYLIRLFHGMLLSATDMIVQFKFNYKYREYCLKGP